jgi:two-component system, NtrC family, response regulator AtoC
MPEALLESELFGHTKGAFTDAHQSRRGVFMKAEGGTLLLDEIGEMPLGMQVKLLRALQERRIRPVGGDSEVEFDARIVAATNKNLEREVSEGRFREDLFYRINVVCVELPPLRARGRDILTLANHLLARSQPSGQRVVGFTSAVVDALLSYSWPGNVRELKNSLERAVALATFDHVRIEDLPDRIRRPSPINDVNRPPDRGRSRKARTPPTLEIHDSRAVSLAPRGRGRQRAPAGARPEPCWSSIHPGYSRGNALTSSSAAIS